jgi:hypothetical protein
MADIAKNERRENSVGDMARILTLRGRKKKPLTAKLVKRPVSPLRKRYPGNKKSRPLRGRH